MKLIFLLIGVAGLFTGALPMIGLGFIGLLFCIGAGAKPAGESLANRKQAEAERQKKAARAAWMEKYGKVE